MGKMILVGIFLLNILTINPVFARVSYTEESIKASGGNDSAHQILYNILDLQNQVDQLNQKNIELEVKLKQQPTVQQVPVQITTQQAPQASPNDATQTQRIDTLEKRVGIVETVVSGLKSAIDKTINLLTKLLSLL